MKSWLYKTLKTQIYVTDVSNMHRHIKCKICDTTILQCKCLGEKVIEYEVCDDCQANQRDKR